MLKFKDFEKFAITDKEKIFGGTTWVCWGKYGDSCNEASSIIYDPDTTTCMTSSVDCDHIPEVNP